MYDTKKDKMHFLYLFKTVPKNYKHFKKKKENKYKNTGYEDFKEEYVFDLRQDYNFLKNDKNK